MFFRRVVTRRHGRTYTYLKLIENYREGGKVKQRVIANLGNIENFTPEKVQSLIAGLARIYDRAMLETEAEEAAQLLDREIDHQLVRDIWKGLGMHNVVRASVRDRSGMGSYMIEAAIMHEVLHPKGSHSLGACYVTTVPELEGHEVSEADFHHVISSFGRSSAPVEIQLLDRLHQAGLIPNPETIIIKLLSSDFTGFECTLSPSGLVYQVQPYHKAIELAVLSSSTGLPLGCRVGFRPFSDEDIIQIVSEAEKNLGSIHTVVSDVRRDGSGDLDQLPVDYLATLQPSRFSEVPIDFFSLWAGKGAETMGRIRVSTADTPEARYIAYYNPSPNAKSDQKLEQAVEESAKELEQLKQHVNKGRIRRRRTVIRKMTEILENRACLPYFNYNLSAAGGAGLNFDYHLDRRALERDKTFRRTQVLKTNLFDVPVKNLVELFQRSKRAERNLEPIRDHTKIPVVPTLTDSLHSDKFIAGQALVQVLGETVRRLESEYGPKVLKNLRK